MQVGVANFPTAYSARAVPLARAVEARGFDSLWVVEHTHIPASRRTPYPPVAIYRAFTGRATSRSRSSHRQLRSPRGSMSAPAFAWCRSITRSRSRNGWHRSTRCRKGVFLFGVGAGWNAEELQNHGVAFADRWQVLRESVLAMKACWTERNAEFHGRFVDFDPVWVEPKPARRPHPPVLIGANSKWAIERVAEFADGWLPILTPDFADRLTELRRACEASDRDPRALDISVFAAPSDKAALEHLAALGVTRVITMLPTAGLDESLAALDGQAALVEWARTL